MGFIEEKLNGYDFNEDTQFIAKRYDIEISDTDKILSLMEDGKLLARIGLAYSNNILTLNGKDDDTEIASIELPNSLVALQNFSLEDGEDGKEIVLSFLQSDGSSTEISLNVEELATVYKAGAGLLLSDDNTFSIKLKSGSLLGFTDNNELDISLEGAYPTYAEISSEFSKYGRKMDEISANTINAVNAVTEALVVSDSAASVANSAITIANNVYSIYDDLENKTEREVTEMKAIVDSLSEQCNAVSSNTVDNLSKINECQNEISSFTVNLENLETLITNESDFRLSGDTANKEYIDSVESDLNRVISTSISNISNDIPKTLSQLENDMNYVTEDKISGWDEKINKIDGLESWISNNHDAENISANTNSILSLQEDLLILSGTVKNIPIIDVEVISSITDDLYALKITVDNNNSATTESITTLEEATNYIDSSIDEINDSIESLSASVNTIDTYSNDIDWTIYATKNDIEGLNLKISEAKTAINNNIDTLSAHTDAIGDLEDRVNKLEAKHASYDSSISAIQEKLDSLTSDGGEITSLKESVNALDNKLGQLSTQYSAMNLQITDILTRLTNLENK